MRTDRIVVITGAAGGMGSVLVERFLDNGDTVVATDTREDGLAALADRYPGARLHTTPADVADETSCAALAEFARRAAGRVDVLVHSAGYFPSVAFDQMTTAQWRQVIDINLTGTFLVVRALLPLMTGRGWGRIVLYGSASIFEGNPGQVHYTAAKAGVVGFTRSLAMALGADGITVNCIAPGLTLTPPVREHLPAELITTQPGRRALPRDQQAADLVGPTLFLASPDADFMSGQTVVVDGGKAKV